MTSFRQIEANRRNALSSTGPKTEDGKRRSRQNAVRHGLTSETVIVALEDIDSKQPSSRTTMPEQPSSASSCSGLRPYCGASAALLPLRPISCRSRPRFWRTADIHSKPPTKRNTAIAWFIVFSGLQRVVTRTMLRDQEGIGKESKLTINRIRSRRPPIIQSPIRVT